MAAPARVNIIGEHTDYNAGLVLPTTTALYTLIAWAPRDDGRLVACSGNLGETRSVELASGLPAPSGDWFDYVVGVLSELHAAGIRPAGTSLYIDSNIPIGGGLSSSASFELALAHALLEVAGEVMGPLELAQLCQRAESGTVGLKCGIMDQYAIACCETNAAMLIDCRTLDAEFIDLPTDATLLIIDTGIKHRLPEGEYNDRRSECEQALEVMQPAQPGLKSLCDLSVSEISGYRELLGDTLYRRALHVVSENQRVAESVVALRQGDLVSLGHKLNESHESLCNDFEVSCEESDRLVALMQGHAGIYGARQVGAGFGGCVLALVVRSAAAAIAADLVATWREQAGIEPWWHIVQPAAVAGPVSNGGTNQPARSSVGQ